MKCKCNSTVWVKPRKHSSPRSRLVVHVKRASLAYSQDKCHLEEYARVPSFVQGLSSPQMTVAWGSFTLKANACTGRRGAGGGAVVWRRKRAALRCDRTRMVPCHLPQVWSPSSWEVPHAHPSALWKQPCMHSSWFQQGWSPSKWSLTRRDWLKGFFPFSLATWGAQHIWCGTRPCFVLCWSRPMEEHHLGADSSW